LHFGPLSKHERKLRQEQLPKDIRR